MIAPTPDPDARDRSGRTTSSLLRDLVYQRIRTGIVEGELPPESRLRDSEFAQEFGVSRTSIREALRRLQDEGLVLPPPAAGRVWLRWTSRKPNACTPSFRLWRAWRFGCSSPSAKSWRTA
ncbi:MAG: GntR family transcriptional regulator [Actinomycetota bacterium]